MIRLNYAGRFEQVRDFVLDCVLKKKSNITRIEFDEIISFYEDVRKDNGSKRYLTWTSQTAQKAS